MTYYGGKQLAASYRTVRKNTLAVAQDIPADNYNFRAAPDSRSVAELLTHIAVGHTFQFEAHAKQRLATLAGYDFPALIQKLTAEEKAPRTKEQIIELLRANGELVAGWLEGLKEGFLSEAVAMPQGANPATRTRFDMLLSMKEHEMHHRGQLMLIERILGIVPHLTRESQARHAAAAQKK